MTAVAPEETHGDSHASHVAKEFTRLYYHILNDNPEYLHQFYGQTSSVTVSETQEDGSNLTVRAETLDLIKALTLRMFAEVRVTLTNCTPQTSLGGSIQLMVSGVMHQKNCDEERLFTQALLLAKQDQGYYVLNDTVHVHSRSSSWKVLNFRGEEGMTQEMSIETAKGVPTPPQEPEAQKETPEEPQDTEPVSPVKEVSEVAPGVESVPSPKMSPAPEAPAFEDEAVGPPVCQNVTPIEKPAVTQPPVATAPAPSVRKSYRDVLKAKRQDPPTPAK